MRIWGNADPRLLNRKHLLGEHQELHTLLGGGWQHHPEHKRFVPEHVEYLILRHELLRIAMDERFSSDHDIDHATPVDITIMRQPLVAFTLEYYDASRFHEHAEDQALWFKQQMSYLGFPATMLAHDAPWDRDCMTVDQYVDVGDDWKHDSHKEGVRDKSSVHIGWTAEPSDWAKEMLDARGIQWKLTTHA